MKAQAGALAHWKLRIHVERERGQENQSPAPGQTVPDHSWLLDVFKWWWSTAGRTWWHRSFAGSSVTTTNTALCSWYSYFLYLFKGEWNSWERRCIKQHNKLLSKSPKKSQWLEVPNLFPALICGGRQGLSLRLHTAQGSLFNLYLVGLGFF